MQMYLKYFPVLFFPRVNTDLILRGNVITRQFQQGPRSGKEIFLWDTEAPIRRPMEENLELQEDIGLIGC
jgi:hypothetical protein